MKRTGLTMAAALAACATLPGPGGDAASLAAAESAFAAQSVREDMRAAFLAHFAPDGLFVRGAWVNAHAWLAPRAAPPIVLDWRPVHVETARAGDIGLSTGPWRITTRGAAQPGGFGQFVSIWTREPGQPWRVAADLGISHEGASLWEAPLEARATPGIALGGTAEEAEADFARESLANGAAAAYRAFAASDLRLYREGHAPWLGRDAALRSGPAPAEAVTWIVERAATAGSGDFGYSLGRFAAPGDGPRGQYLRAWRREAAGWRIVLDVVNPAKG
jgi:ketosteroid isomerase-like protein